jgi:heme-degrading monooxygenase HmoA
MFAVIWEYEVHTGREGDFTALYGGEGAWVGLFREYTGYVGTELLCDTSQPRRFVTVDRWISQAAYDAFLTATKPRYADIDALGDALTANERCIGRFELA